jgi:hypothetical protein
VVTVSQEYPEEDETNKEDCAGNAQTGADNSTNAVMRVLRGIGRGEDG